MGFVVPWSNTHNETVIELGDSIFRSCEIKTSDDTTVAFDVSHEGYPLPTRQTQLVLVRHAWPVWRWRWLWHILDLGRCKWEIVWKCTEASFDKMT